MKELVLSAVLGMFCYCTNNAMEDPQPVEVKDINDVLNIMIQGQAKILKAKEGLETCKNQIYSQINAKGQVTKKKLLDFIKSGFTEEEQKYERFSGDMENLQQYFHLEVKKEEDVCTKDNLTEIFWSEEGKHNNQIIGKEEGGEAIRNYIIAIIFAEEELR